METFSDLTKPGSSVYFQYNYPRASKTQRLWKLCDSLFGLYFIVCFTFNTSREKTVRGRLRSTDVFGKLEASPKDYKRGKYRPRFSVWSISNDYELFLLIPELFLYCFPAKVSLYMFYFDSLHKWKAKHKKHENKVEGYMHLREDSEILPGEHVASSSLQYIKYTVGIHSVHDWAFHCHLCFTVCVCVCVLTSVVHFTELQVNLSVKLSSWATASMRRYCTTITSLWLWNQAHCTNKDKSEQAWQRKKIYGDVEGDAAEALYCAWEEAEAEIWA